MKDKITIVSFLTIIFGGALLLVVLPEVDISMRERRKMVTVSKLKEDFVGKLDDYMSDQFPFRDSFISLASFTDRLVFRNSSANDVYVENGYLIEKNYPLNTKSIDNFVRKISYIDDNYLYNSRVFYTLIPDKSYFLDRGMKADFEELKRRIRSLNMSYIDAFDSFDLEDYYRTDIHIKQPAYVGFVDKLGDALSFEKSQVAYTKRTYDAFYGATYSKVPFVEPDELVYLDNASINRADVWHLEYGSRPVYDEDALSSIDGYNVFLSGASSIIEITNRDGEDAGRELIIFRDSFASSLAPLLIPYYKKITLVDLRYISFDNAVKYLNFEGSDVLFMYSTLIANNSELLKVSIK